MFEPGLVDFRPQRGLEIAQKATIRQVVRGKYLVPSATGAGGYVVDTGAESCTCPDHELRGSVTKCKHRIAVELVRSRAVVPDGVKVKRVQYSQDWASYNKAQCEEKERVLVLLRSLCNQIPFVPQEGRGKRRAQPADVVFAAISKTFGGLSGRRSTSDVRDCAAKGLVERAVSYNCVFEHMASPEITTLLRQLVRVSASPLRHVERRFAIDGTGFTTSVYERYFTEKYGTKHERRESRGVKLHAICGVDTLVITAAEVTDISLHDSPLLPQLVRETAGQFTVHEVMADKGYLGRANLTAIEEVGATPYVAFKINSRPSTDSAVWQRAFHAFAFHRKKWLEKYHQRSNVEALFSSMKRKFGGSVRARSDVSMLNEVLCKCVAHNLSMLVHASIELGIQADIWGSK